jgi:hypothetical protein
MNASRSVTSFTLITTSDNGRDKHSKGRFVHVIHGPAAPAHKATKEASAGPSFGDSYATYSTVGPQTAGRLYAPDDAQVEPPEVDVGRRATASVGHLTTRSPREGQWRLVAA